MALIAELGAGFAFADAVLWCRMHGVDDSDDALDVIEIARRGLQLRGTGA